MKDDPLRDLVTAGIAITGTDDKRADPRDFYQPAPPLSEFEQGEIEALVQVRGFIIKHGLKEVDAFCMQRLHDIRMDARHRASKEGRPMSDTYGKMDAAIGERCSNAGFEDRFTSPCCYADFVGERDDCPECGAPLICTVEHEPQAVCTIGTKDDE